MFGLAALFVAFLAIVGSLYLYGVSNAIEHVMKGLGL
jgi:hypothetical protein